MVLVAYLGRRSLKSKFWELFECIITMNAEQNLLQASMDSLDSLVSHDLESRRQHQGDLNDAFISSDESESGGSSASSGYSSRASSVRDLSDISDVEDSEQSMVFENTKSLLHTLEYILCVREMCDVTFLAGKKKEPVHGLQAVMGARSRIFYQLFLIHKKKTETSTQGRRGFLSLFRKRRQSEPEPRTAGQACQTRENHLTIPVPEYDDDVFRRVVSYVHYGHVTVTSESAIGLICAATEFQLDDLRKACWDFVNRCLTSGNVTTLIKSGSQYKKRPHVKLFMKMISKIRQ